MTPSWLTIDRSAIFITAVVALIGAWPEFGSWLEARPSIAVYEWEHDGLQIYRYGLFIRNTVKVENTSSRTFNVRNVMIGSFDKRQKIFSQVTPSDFIVQGRDGGNLQLPVRLEPNEFISITFDGSLSVSTSDLAEFEDVIFDAGYDLTHLENISTLGVGDPISTEDAASLLARSITPGVVRGQVVRQCHKDDRFTNDRMNLLTICTRLSLLLTTGVTLSSEPVGFGFLSSM